MKKFLFLAMAAAAMVSCSQNEEIENATQNAEIKFGAVVKTSTRADIVTSAGFEQFKVYGFKTSGKIGADVDRTAFMNGVLVSKDKTTSKWTYEGAYYWPGTDLVQFFSVVPDVAISAGKGYPTFNYTVGTIDTQKDLVAANLIDKGKTSGELKLPFSHLLTQVNFSIKGDKDFTYTLTNLELVGVKDVGTFTFNGSATAGTWTSVTSSAAPAKYEFTGTKTLVSTAGTEVVKLEDENTSLFMLLPQPIDGTNVKVKVTYSAKLTTDANQVTVDNETKVIELPNNTWEKGKRIRYTLNLTSDGSNIVFSAPAWEDWAEQETDGGSVTPATEQQPTV